MKNAPTHISPVADRVIAKCGGVRKVAEITERAVSSVYKWTYSKEQGGTGGLVPSEAQVSLMAASNRGEVDLRPDDFFEDA